MAAKIAEALEHIKAAERASRTNVFRWKPDFDTAAEEYTLAAQAYRIAKDLANAKECHIQAANFHKRNRAFFHAAKSLENAMMVSKTILTHEQIKAFALEASDLYRQHGSGDSAAALLDKAAKIVESSPEIAVILYQEAAEVSSDLSLDMFTANEPIIPPQLVERITIPAIPYSRPLNEEQSEEELSDVDVDLEIDEPKHQNEDDDMSDDIDVPRRAANGANLFSLRNAYQTESSQHQGSEYISKASRILVKLQWYDKAVDSIRREIGFHQESGNTGAIGRLTVAIVLVQLARGDTVAAEKAYKEWGSNCEVAEMQTLEQILQAYDEEDRESARRALASPFIRNMDVEYARLAATVPLPESMEPAPRAAIKENAAPSYVSPNAQAATSSTACADVVREEVEESPYATVTYVKKSDDEDGLC